MHDLLYVAALIGSWFIALVWTAAVTGALRHLPRVPNLLAPLCDPAPAQPGSGERPQITVIVPARNEAAAIEATLRSLLAQTIPLEILAVNDRSTDATGAIMDSIAAGPLPSGKFLSVIHVDSLPPGWMGKSHALALAARQTSTPWLLFTDGDILFREDVLARAMRYIEQIAPHHLVLLPTLLLKTPGERMMAGIFQNLSLLSWRPWKIADPAAQHDSIGIGAFNLIRSDVYRAVGGFEAFPMEILEDLRIGYEIKHRGYRQHIVFGRNLICLHWAAGAFGLVHNLTKNLYATFRFRPFLLLGASLILALLCFVPFAGLFAGWPIRSANLLSLLMIWLHYRYSARHFTAISSVYVLMLPVAAALVLYAMLRSMILTLVRGGVVWRGTFYPLRDLRRNLGRLR